MCLAYPKGAQPITFTESLWETILICHNVTMRLSLIKFSALMSGTSVKYLVFVFRFHQAYSFFERKLKNKTKKMAIFHFFNLSMNCFDDVWIDYMFFLLYVSIEFENEKYMTLCMRV